MNYIENNDVLIPVMSVTCNYHSMVRFGESVIVKISVEQFNGIKISLKYEIVDAKTLELRTTGSSLHCFIDGDGKLLSLKKNRPDIYERLKVLCI